MGHHFPTPCVSEWSFLGDGTPCLTRSLLGSDWWMGTVLVVRMQTVETIRLPFYWRIETVLKIFSTPFFEGFYGVASFIGWEGCYNVHFGVCVYFYRFSPVRLPESTVHVDERHICFLRRSEWVFVEECRYGSVLHCDRSTKTPVLNPLPVRGRGSKGTLSWNERWDIREQGFSHWKHCSLKPFTLVYSPNRGTDS